MIVLDTEHYILESVRDEDGEHDGFVASCRHCDWHSAAGAADDAEQETRFHLATKHPEPKDQPEDVAKVELDKGLEGIDFALQVPTDRRSYSQAQAQLHLLASIATSLYELRTRGMQLYELLAVPQVTVMSKDDAAARLRAIAAKLSVQDQESIRRGLDDAAKGRVQARDDVTSGPTCDDCDHPIEWHNKFGGCIAFHIDGVRCPCEAGSKP